MKVFLISYQRAFFLQVYQFWNLGFWNLGLGWALPTLTFRVVFRRESINPAIASDA